MATYLDTSALVKLIVAEPESAALRGWLTERDRSPITCDLARTELLRAVRRADASLAPQVRAVLDAVTVMTVPTAVFAAAGRLDPTSLRSLDAIHLASALSLGDDLEWFVTYDARLADAASVNGLPVAAPRQTRLPSRRRPEVEGGENATPEADRHR